MFIALLYGGSAIFQISLAHSEGIEAADPSTPAARLTFNSAMVGYIQGDSEPLSWRDLFDGRPHSGMSMNHPSTDSGSSMHQDHTDDTLGESANIDQ